MPTRNLCCFVLLLFWAASGYAQSQSYLFVWAGNDAKKSNDFLAVLDADAASPHYGQAVASVAVPGATAGFTTTQNWRLRPQLPHAAPPIP